MTLGRLSVVCFLLSLACTTSWARQTKPNIILIVADDLGWAELGCYGNRFNETPNLDRLARDGLRFTQAYSAGPVCSPTRAAIVTGNYPSRTGITDFLPAKTDKFLDPAKWVTLNEMLAGAGYLTCEIGKWHLDTNFQNNRGGPRAHGFHEVIGTETKYIADGDYFFPYDKVATLTTGKDGEFLTDRLAEEAVAFLRRRGKESKPFLVQLNFYSVHTVLAAPQPLVAKYKSKYEALHGASSAKPFDDPKNSRHSGKPHNPYLAAMLEAMDAGVGRIVAALDELKLADNTIVVFTSDNGGALDVTDNAPLRSGKTWLYEGGIRVPQIVRWPAVIKPGRTCDEPTCSIDYYPTFADVAGVALPTDQAVDGVSLHPLFRGDDSLPRDTLFWHYPADSVPWPKRAASAIRQGDLKLIEFHSDGRRELFDLKHDPGESKDVAQQLPDEAERLHGRLQKWRASLTP